MIFIGDVMAEIIVLGAGLGGTMMAYELRDKLDAHHNITLVTKGNTYQFVPSNPWVAVGMRKREDVEVVLVSMDELVQLFKENKFIQSMHMTGIFLALQKLGKLTV